VAPVGGAPGESRMPHVAGARLFSAQLFVIVGSERAALRTKKSVRTYPSIYIFSDPRNDLTLKCGEVLFFFCVFFCCALSKKSIFKYCLLPVKSVEERRVPWMSIAIMRTSRKNKQFPSGFLRPRLVYLSIQL